jgi:flagellar protein FliO/FliZ
VSVLALLQEPALPFAGDPTMLGGRALLIAAIVVGLLAAAGWLLRRNSPLARGRRAVTVETAVSLGERRSLVIVSVEGRRLLLGLAPGHISLVTDLGAVPASGTTGSFSETLDASLAPRNTPGDAS